MSDLTSTIPTWGARLMAMSRGPDRFAQRDLPSTNGYGIATESDWPTSVLVRELIPVSLQ